MKSLSEEFEDQTAAYGLQRAKFEALRDALGNYDNYKYVNFYDFLDPNNQYWNDYEYKLPGDWFEKQHGRIEMDSPVGWFINNIRNAETINDVYKQSELWNSYDPLSSRDNTRKYLRLMVGGSQPESPTTNEPNPAQITAGDTAGGAQGVVTGGSTQGTQTGGTGGIPSTQGVQGAQAGVKSGNAVAGGGVQGSNNGSGKKPRMSDAEINAFLNEELGGDTTGNGIYASAGVPKGGTKTIGYDPYDPNPGNVSLAYAMRNAPEQERRTALINKWNQEHGISYATGKDGLIYRTDPQHPNGYVDPFKNDLSKTGSTGYATGQGMLTSGSNGTYATGEGIKDANGNVLTNPGGNWEYQYALRDPQYGLGMMGKMSDAQKNYLQAVSNGMGYNYNFTGATRFV